MSGSKSEQEYDRLWSKRLNEYGRVLMKWTQFTDDVIGDGMQIKELRIKTPMQTGGEFLLIVKAEVEGRKLIAFHGAETMEEALAGALGKFQKNALTWKDDKPFEGR